MGTLTANVPRLNDHCPHKLATSCRLTSTPRCCACADIRPHSLTYSVYIDGVGFVQRGTRWQSYCWFCKEFWNNRIASTDPPLQPSQTRIPQIPDQTQFLERWFEFYQGYRVVIRENGAEHRIAVIGEPLKDVSPGLLPRTHDELIAGRLNDATRPENRTATVQTTTGTLNSSEPERTLEEALDSLLEEASDTEEDPHPVRQDIEVGTTSMPGPEIVSLNARRDPNIRYGPQNAPREPVSRRLADRFTRIFGTREEIQSDDYQSPIAGMYSRAWERHRLAEAARREGGPEVSSSELPESNMAPGTSRVGRLLSGSEDRWRSHFAPYDSHAQMLAADLRPSLPSNIHSQPLLSPANPNSQAGSIAAHNDFVGSLERPLEPPPEPPSSTYRPAPDPNRRLPADETTSIPANGLDGDARPAPRTDEDMMVKLECKICYSQLADTACLPCGHMVMCHWCADIAIPVHHGNIPQMPSKCPMCRKVAKQRVRIRHG
ncbi:hypothetical protein K432DRAFT_323819 [Lepidopterella palustris CBS 459.81]|uniref:RING-type domain-containing protein n=1 Tax=Lepidopterella palustris CBS 459.81 TaxID=1314670 RepID=A0A8E2EF72_9PEZI|nr:hypothetical protein K432DRAFT_323819 [Lepidopterella palustris CBS 459.81]